MNQHKIIPEPLFVKLSGESFLLTNQTVLVAEDKAIQIAKLFMNWIQIPTGFAFDIRPGNRKAESTILFELCQQKLDLNDEGYKILISPQTIHLQANSISGLRYAAQTLRQLLPEEIFAVELVNGLNWTVPCGEIIDQPRFPWRGAMLDVCRHFMPLEFIYKFLDLLSLHKMNVFHWHLTEDQGWRIEIKRYPLLTEIGAWRSQTLVGHYNQNRDHPQFDGIKHGGFYTQEEIRQVVAYAENLGIRVVPEIEMPGHAQAAIAAYPEFGNISQKLEVSTSWGIHEHVYNVEERTFEFLQHVLEEILDLFPSPYIHIGGDEVPKVEWKNSREAQQKMKDLYLNSEEELQSYFIKRIDNFLTSHQRHLIGWDEILEGGLAPNAAVMSWRGEVGGIAAAHAGHDVVMAPNTYTYFDYYQSDQKENEPLAIGGFLPLETVYKYNPTPEVLEEGKTKHILGTQCQLWTEYIPTPDIAEYMAFPRLCALSEVAWSPISSKDYTSFINRLQSHLKRLDHLKVNYRKLE